ncbi:hypothetical protein B5X24_HaOG203775 [Helicoverpa armigera]|nr:hypothetical protein B5X24_HaOG203775 [Helicoverpa armigera]
MKVQRAMKNMGDELLKDILKQLSLGYIEPPRKKSKESPGSYQDHHHHHLSYRKSTSAHIPGTNFLKVSSIHNDMELPLPVELEEDDEEEVSITTAASRYQQDFKIQCLINQVGLTPNYSLRTNKSNSENTIQESDESSLVDKSTSTVHLYETSDVKMPLNGVQSPFTQLQQVFLIEEAPTPGDKIQTVLNKTLSQGTKSTPVSVESKDILIRTPKESLKSAQSKVIEKHSTQTSEKCYQSDRPSRVTICETPMYKPSTESSSDSPDDVETQTEKEITVVSETSLKTTILKPASSTSIEESPSKEPSKVASIVKKLIKLLPKISKKHELIVIKHPEELVDYSHDEFIPPVALKNFAIQANIVNIEELYDVEENTLKVQKYSELIEDGEILKTGEYIEADSGKIATNPEISVPSGSNTILSEKGIETSSVLFSRCELPVHQSSQSHLLVSDESTMERESLLSDNFVTALEELKSPNREMLSKEFSVNSQNYRHFKDKFRPANELNHALTEQCINVLSSSSTDTKLNILPKVIAKSGKAYAYIVDSESSRGSDVDLVQLHRIVTACPKMLRKPLKILNSDEIFKAQSESDVD